MTPEIVIVALWLVGVVAFLVAGWLLVGPNGLMRD